MRKQMEEAPPIIMLCDPFATFSLCIFNVLCFAPMGGMPLAADAPTVPMDWKVRFPQATRWTKEEELQCRWSDCAWPLRWKGIAAYRTQGSESPRSLWRKDSRLSAAQSCLSQGQTLPGTARAGQWSRQSSPPGWHTVQFCFCSCNITGEDRFQRTQWAPWLAVRGRRNTGRPPGSHEVASSTATATANGESKWNTAATW